MQDYWTPWGQCLRPHVGVAASLLVVFALFTQGFVIKREAAAVNTNKLEAESPLQRVLTEFGKLVEKTVEIRFQRDALILEAARQRHDQSIKSMARTSPLDPIENDALIFNQVHESIRDSIHYLDVNTAWLASDIETIAFDGLNARTAVKAIQLIEAAKADGIELKVIAGCRSGEQRRNFPGQGKAVLPLSTHSAGLAFDVVALKDGRMDFGPSEELSRVGAIGKTLGLIWGGEFSRYKAWSHFELPIARRELGKLKSDAN